MLTPGSGLWPRNSETLQHIIPSVYEDKYFGAENAGGFLYSGVLIRKISETAMDWPLNSADVTDDAYPE